jgi:pimeloyl-ACP methyl ester carboxylesterase
VRRTITILAALVLSAAGFAGARKTVTFPTEDGGVIFADLYAPLNSPEKASTERGVVLAHGGQFNKESWAKQARVLADAGFEVLAIDFRGYGKSHGPGDSDVLSAPLKLDVLAAVRYLKTSGVQHISLVGGSMGGSAAADASIALPPGAIDRVVILGAAPNEPAEKLHTPTLWIVARDDTSGSGPRLPGIRAQFEKAPEPKQLILLDGSAHAQWLFQTDQADRVMQEILHFLSAK